MENSKAYMKPVPVINKKERESLKELTERYEKLTKPTKFSIAGEKVAQVIPKQIKKAGESIKDTVAEADLFAECMKVVGKGFDVLEKNAAKTTISEKRIVEKVNSTIKNNEITCLEEICLARGYNISKISAKYKTKDLLLALAEGGSTGAFGFSGIPFNLVLSTFIYYRAVQSIAMIYGYDVKNDAGELMVAGNVFMNALSPASQGSNEVSSIIGKIMLMTEVTAVKQTSKKTWQEMAARGGIGLLLTQMRALANKSAQKALEKAGQKGLEENVFKGIFEQIGKGLSKKAIGRAVPIAGAVIGGLFDTAQMNTILEYADVFYNKRFLMEKEVRVNMLMEGNRDEIIDIDFVDI